MGRRSDARERLIGAATELWHARSYADVGVSEICDRAGVQKGSFYHFFAAKRDLAIAVIDAWWQRLGVGEFAPLLTGSLPPLERLSRFVERGLEAQIALRGSVGCTLGCPFGNLVVELATVDEVVRERLARLFDEWTGLIQHAVDDAVAAGEIPEIDTAQAARAVLAYSEGLAVMMKAEDDPDVVRDLIPGALRLVGADPAAVRAPAGS